MSQPSAASPETPPVLVAFSTHSGSTRDTAEQLAQTIRAYGHAVDVARVDDVIDPSGYGAVILGSPVFDGHWTAAAEAFVDRHRDALRATPLWLFSVGTFGDDRRLIGPMMRREPRGIGVLVRDLGAHDYRVFAGVVKRHDWPLTARIFFHLLGGRLGDHRDWASVRNWATEISAGLPAAGPVVTQVAEAAASKAD